MLTPESAVQVALLNNPGLQAAYADLGLSETELVQAGRLPNPGFSYENTSGGAAQEIERSLEFGIISLLTMPFRVDIEKRRFEAAKLRAAAGRPRNGDQESLLQRGCRGSSNELHA